MTGDNGDPVNFLDLVRHIRESAIVVWNEMDANKNGYIDYKGNLLKGIGSLSSVRFKSTRIFCFAEFNDFCGSICGTVVIK